MRYLSVCSGIEAATVAWHPLGWEAAAFSEIEKFPRAVLQHHYPDTPLHGDFTTIGADEYGPIDLLVGGTPCQSFSIAGLRGGLADDRGNLALEFLRLAQRTRAKWLVWENVPGVLSSNGGRDFGAILGGMVELGYGFAYRVLDAQFFGVPQRRRRVFVVGHLGDWRRAAAVLFERHSLQGHPAPRREAGEVAAKCLTRGAGQRFDFETEDLIAEGVDLQNSALTGDVAGTLLGEAQKRGNVGLGVCHSLRGEGFDASEDGTGRGTPLVPVQHPPEVAGTLKACGGKSGLPNGAEEADRMVPIAFSAKDHGADAMEDCSPTLRAGGHSKSHANAGVMPAIAYGQAIKTTGHQGDNVIGEGDVWPCLAAQNANNGGGAGAILHATSAVRRLTPRECERLQGFPDDYTLIPWRGKPADEVADGPRYKALGNSMAVPVMRWIGERVAAVEALQHPQPVDAASGDTAELLASPAPVSAPFHSSEIARA